MKMNKTVNLPFPLFPLSLLSFSYTYFIPQKRYEFSCIPWFPFDFSLFSSVSSVSPWYNYRCNIRCRQSGD
jgi:hypothetical protein